MNILRVVIVILVLYFAVLYFLNKIIKAYNKENKKLNIIISIILWGFFIVLVFSPLFFIELGNFSLGMFGFGSIFAFIGGIVFTNSKDSENNKMNKFDRKANMLWIGLMSIIGLVIMLISAVTYLEPEFWVNIENLIIPLLGISIFPIVGIIMLYLGFRSIKVPKEFSMEIDAKCIEIDMKLSNNSNGRRLSRSYVYAPVYSYIYNGREYKGCDNIYTHKGICPKEGESFKLNIDPQIPYLFWDKKRRSYNAKGLFFLGIMFTIIGSVCFILFLKSKNIL